MIYTTDVEEGGYTFFPRARPAAADDDADVPAERPRAAATGIRIQPQKGRGLCFWNVRGGREDDASLHEAQPVLAGTKMIATKWLTFADPAA
jgi:prolyl 4-hydroxylase